MDHWGDTALWVQKEGRGQLHCFSLHIEIFSLNFCFEALPPDL